MKELNKKYIIKADIKKVWEALTDGACFTIWSGAPAVINAKNNTPFSLWGGEVIGKTLKLIKHKELEQEWNFGNWQIPSNVKFLFIKKGNDTEVLLIHSHIPDLEFADIDSGWDKYVFEPIKEFLE